MVKANVTDLSAPQRKTLELIERFINETGLPPTIHELANRLKISGPSVHQQIKYLIEKGFLRREKGKARGLKLIQEKIHLKRLVAVPTLGEVPAGKPIGAEECPENQLLVDEQTVGDSPCFALRVVGESMRDANINDGDYVIVRKQPLAEHGDIVVASIEGEVTLKRLFFAEGKIELRPENKKFRAITIQPDQDFSILGKLIATRRVIAQEKKSAVAKSL